jgi:hypothetical protein
MSAKLELIDRALALGQAELDFLAAGDFLRAEESATQRGQLLDDALGMAEETSVEALLAKLVKLKNLQGRLTSEARTIHARMQEDLTRVRQETRRYAGYHEAVSVKPPASRYLSKRG